MIIERPRTPALINIRGKLRHRVGYAQKQALDHLAKLGKDERPPKGMLTAAGVLREHIFNDMIPLGWVEVKVLHPGFTRYVISKLGDDVRRHGKVMDKPKRAKSLMNRQRARATVASQAKERATAHRTRGRGHRAA